LRREGIRYEQTEKKEKGGEERGGGGGGGGGGGDVCEFNCLREWSGAATRRGVRFRWLQRSSGQSDHRFPGAIDLMYNYTYV